MTTTVQQSTISRLPKSTQEMAALIGLENALSVAAALGTRFISIPLGKRAAGRQALARLAAELGSAELAATLVQHYGGTHIYIARGDIPASDSRARRNLEIHQAADEALRAGKTLAPVVNAMARRYALSARTVWKVLKQPAPVLSGGQQ